jgi:hypothetical protein
MVTWLLSMGVPQDQVEKLGWKHESSDEYMRATRRVVESLQLRLAETLRKDKVIDFGDEAQVLVDLAQFWQLRDEDHQSVQAQVDKLRLCHAELLIGDPEGTLVGNNGRVYQMNPKRLKRESIPTEDSEVASKMGKATLKIASIPLNRALKAEPDEDDAEEEKKVETPEPGLYVAILAKTVKCGGKQRPYRRLHRWRMPGACNRWPGVDYREFEKVPKGDHISAFYDDFCRRCWRNTSSPEETAVADAEDQDDTSGSDSPSSSDPGEDEAVPAEPSAASSKPLGSFLSSQQ